MWSSPMWTRLANMRAAQHVSFPMHPPGDHDAMLERPDEYDPVQTKTNDKLTDEHTDDLEHEKTANMKQARRACLCSPR